MSAVNSSSNAISSNATSASAKKRRNSNPMPNADAIKVICRFRPPRAVPKKDFSNKADKYTFNVDAFKLNDDSSEVEFVSDFQAPKTFKFDKVLAHHYCGYFPYHFDIHSLFCYLFVCV